MRWLPKIVGGALIVVGSIGSCNVAWSYLSHRNKVRCERRAKVFMERLQREDWVWIAGAMQNGKDGVQELKYLNGSCGSLQSWAVDGWFGYPYQVPGGVFGTTTRRGTKRRFEMQIGPGETPLITAYGEENP